MTKWFDTNYHYIVPELTPARPSASPANRCSSRSRARRRWAGRQARDPGSADLAVPGQGRCLCRRAADAGKLKLLENLLPVYQAVLARCAQQGVQWAQIDEPILALDLPQAWRDAFKQVYAALSSSPLKLLVATYFDGLKDNLPTALVLPVAGLHVTWCARRNSWPRSLPACAPTRCCRRA